MCDPVGFEQVRISSKPALDKKKLKERSLLEIGKDMDAHPYLCLREEQLGKRKIRLYRGKLSRLVLRHRPRKGKPIGIKAYNDLVMHTIELGYWPGTRE